MNRSLLPYILRYAFPDREDLYELSDDGNGAYISKWMLDTSKPTDNELSIIAESVEFRLWYQNYERGLIDRETGKAIDKAVHPLAGQEEQIGILRDQMVRMLNGNMTPSEDFARLNEIAIQAVEAGQEKKAAL